MGATSFENVGPDAVLAESWPSAAGCVVPIVTPVNRVVRARPVNLAPRSRLVII
jgi:hypothetical protein